LGYDILMLLERYGIDSFMLFIFIGLALMIIGMLALFSWADGIKQEGYADIDRMGCGELKEFITEKGWKEYQARGNSIGEQALHTYTWRCEK